ncbi:MAG: DUF4369 domain-containing protein [Lentimicrobium sp.]|nr:DUF4369 domain-containing protein [Lentimicrobium sp.]
MIKLFQFSFIFLLTWHNAYPADYKINGKIEGISGGKIYLQEFYGDQNTIIDSVIADKTGNFSFNLGFQKAPGQLRLIFAERRFLDFVFTKETISFSTSLEHLLEDITITESVENQVYYQYLKFRAKSQKRIDELRKQLYTFDSTSVFSRELNAEYSHIVRQEEEYVQLILTNHPDLLATAFIRIDREPNPDLSWNKERANRWVFDHYPDHFMFSDTALLRSNAISAKIISYLSVALSIHNHPDSLENIFSEASFRLLASTGNDSVLFNFMRGYLSNGFITLGYKSLSAFLSEIPYPCCPCETLGQIRNSGKNQSGRMPPYIFLENQNGKKIKLSLRNNPERIFLAIADCRWSDLIFEKLMKQNKTPTGDGIETIYILKKSEKIPVQLSHFTFYFISEKEISKIYKITGRNQRPQLIITDAEGEVTGTFNSWLEMIQMKLL